MVYLTLVVSFIILLRNKKERVMGCCNQAPNGGGDVKLGLKVFGIIAVIVLLMVVIFG